MLMHKSHMDLARHWAQGWKAEQLTLGGCRRELELLITVIQPPSPAARNSLNFFALSPTLISIHTLQSDPASSISQSKDKGCPFGEQRMDTERHQALQHRTACCCSA